MPTDTREPWDVRGVIARLMDGSRFEEFKSNYGKTLVTGMPFSYRQVLHCRDTYRPLELVFLSLLGGNTAIRSS